MKTLGLVYRVVAHSEDGVLAAPPHTLDVNRVSQVPDFLLGIERIVVGGVHDAWNTHISRIQRRVTSD